MPGFGDAVRRREDFRFITGRGRYVDDFSPEGLLHAAFVRCPHAHALVQSVDTSAARDAAGVVAVLIAADAVADGITTLPAAVDLVRPDGSKAVAPKRPVLVGDRVRHVGEPVAMVVAETQAAAEDAAELVAVDYEALASVGRRPEALAQGAPLVWDDVPGNVAFLWRRGDHDAVDAALKQAAHVTRAEIVVNRVTAAPIEPRASLGSVEAGRLTLRTSTQGPHQLRDGLAGIFGVTAADVHVIAEDVGGSFGMKSGVYREDVLVLWAARRLGRAVKWASGRAEAFLADEHGRDMVAATELALDADGNFLAFRARFDLNVGAYLSPRSLPVMFNIGGISGVYRTPVGAADIRGIFTNAQPTGPYRGAGRPEATYAIERTIDIAAREIGIDPFELRQRNLVPAEAMPFQTGFLFRFDCGDFAANMRRAAEIADRDGFAARRAASAARGRLRGLGVANSVEVAGGPFGKPGKDAARLVAQPDGTVHLEVGAMSVGQGLETSLTSLAAERLGIAPERVIFHQGDTDRDPAGRGSGGSSAMPTGAPAAAKAVARLIELARERAAEALEVSVADVEYGEGALRVVGTDRVVTLAELAGGAAGPDATPGAAARPSDIGPLSADADFLPEDVTYPNGCHLVEVEVDPETGRTEILRYVAVEDIGHVLNPLLAEGQMHGGIVQGAGQALFEGMVHDSSGEVVSGSFSDYAMPRAGDFPLFEVATQAVPATANPLGMKGVGEAGTVGALAATMNAVCDALAGHGVHDLAMPATTERVWAALAAARR